MTQLMKLAHTRVVILFLTLIIIFNVDGVTFSMIKPNTYVKGEILQSLQVPLKLELEATKVLSTLSAGNYAIQNNNKSSKKLTFYLSDHRENWEKFEIFGGKAEEFPVNKYHYIKIGTANSGYVEYKMSASQRYTIKWDYSNKRWDLFRLPKS